MTHSKRLPIVLLLGLSGSGKSTLAEFLGKEQRFLHLELDRRNVPEDDTMCLEDLMTEWIALRCDCDAAPLATAIRERVIAAELSGAVLSFSSLLVLPVTQIQSAKKQGISTLICHGTQSECERAFLARETASKSGLDLSSWRDNNLATYRQFCRDEFTPFRLHMFESGTHRNPTDLAREVQERAAG